MTWKAEPIKHFLEVTNFGADGGEFTTSEEYNKGKHSSTFSLHLLKDDTELRVIPYTLEHLKKLVKGDYSNNVFNELFVGIRNATDIVYVGKSWNSKQFKEKKINQYFFKNDKPSAFNSNYVSAPGWPLNQQPILGEILIQYFDELKNIRPDITNSLDKCIEHLTKAGPEYTGESNGSISFKLS